MIEHPSQPRGRKNEPEAMRRRVLDVAAELFHSRGYHPTSMHDITREARVTSGALHHHFPTKKMLGLAVIQERVANAVEETWINPINSAHAASDGILAVFRQVIAQLEKRREVKGCPLNNLAMELSLSDPEFRTSIEAVFERWRASIACRIRSDQPTGGLKSLDADRFATFVVASYSGAMALAKASQDAGPLKTCAEQLADLFAGLRRGAPRGRRFRVDDPRGTPGRATRPARRKQV
jgi:AcrR family transcriptional regulator